MLTNRPQRAVPAHRPFKFNLPAFEEDPKLAYLDSVFATLISSRFGDGAKYVLTPRIEPRTTDESLDFLDLSERAGIGWHDAESLGRETLGRTATLQWPARNKGIASDTTTLGRNLTAFKTPSNLARGSPNILGRFFFAFLPLRT